MLINCKECGREISDTAKQCPHCGAKVKKEKQKTQSKFTSSISRFVELVKSRKKGKLIYLSTLISCCAIAVCFFIIMMTAYCAPKAFLHSKAYKSFYSADTCGAYTYEDYRFNIFRSAMGDSESVIANVNTSSNDFQVNYQFDSDGIVKVIFMGNGIGGHIECEYEVKDLKLQYIAAYKNYRPTTLSTLELNLAQTSIELVHVVYDIVLTSKGYNFNDVLTEYGQYRDSLNGIRISSIVLMSVFTVISVLGTVFYIITFVKKKGKDDLREEMKDAQELNEAQE